MGTASIFKDDFLLQSLKKRLENYYIIEEENFPFSRLLTKLKNEKYYCAYSILETPERREFAYFSRYHSIQRSPVILSKISSLSKYINENNKISLTRIFELEENFVLGLEQDKNWNELTQIINELRIKYEANVFDRPGIGSIEALFRMLNNNRVSGILTLLSSIEKLKKEDIKNFNKKYIVLDILENQREISTLHIACNKNKLGFEVIQRVNRILNDPNFKLIDKNMEMLRQVFGEETLKTFRNYYLGIEKNLEK